MSKKQFRQSKVSSQSKKSPSDRSVADSCGCFYVVDACGCKVVDPCGCYVSQCCC